MRKIFTPSTGNGNTPRMRKKFAAYPHILAALAGLLVCLNAQAYDFDYDGFYYNVVNPTDHTVAVTSGDTDYSGDIVIPSQTTFHGQQWRVVEIDSYTFSGEEELTSVFIPKSITTIWFGAFQDCSSLTSIIVDENNPNYSSQEGMFFNKDLTTLLQVPGGKTQVQIPNSVTAIVEHAFYGCRSLVSVEIPNSVTEIGSGVFISCNSLVSVEIPNSVTEIGHSVFYGCNSLVSVELPNSITKIQGGTFCKCSSLVSVEIPNSVTKIGSEAFRQCSSLVSVEIPNSVTKIGEYTFAGCSSLASVEIPNSVTEIGERAFSGCSSMVSVEIPNSVTKVGTDAFYGCSSLGEIYVQPTVPPVCDFYYPFDERTYASAHLYVPEESLEAYRTTSPWSRFVNIQVNGIEETEMEVENQIVVADGQVRVNHLAEGAVVEVYGADGREVVRTREAVVNGLPAGVYIVRIGNRSQTVRL